MLADLTIIYYTANVISDFFAENVRRQLVIAAGNYPIISVSRKPLGFGKNICVGEQPLSPYTIYKNVLLGAKEARTKYVATVEDDILYHSFHFQEYRPNDDEFGYNKNKWGLYTWTNPPVFSFKDRFVMSNLIAPRELLIETLEERFQKYKTIDSINIDTFGEPGRYEGNNGLTIRKRVEWWSSIPNIVFSHEKALGYQHLGTRKRLGDKKETSLPYWGSADKIRRLYD